VLTTQYMEEAQQLCDRIVIMNEGKILKGGIPEDMIRDEIGQEVVEVRVQSDMDDKIIAHLSGLSVHHERIGDTLYLYSREGHAVMRKVIELDLPKVLNRPATLEDVFLKLTGRSLGE
jgi:lipooligosaccharide transport system ATP-binding protein